jgi:hypothetical protein
VESFQVVSPPVFVRTSGIIDFAVSGFQSTSVSSMVSSTTQTASPLVLAARLWDRRRAVTCGREFMDWENVVGGMCPVCRGA